jgi:hypothetical protein
LGRANPAFGAAACANSICKWQAPRPPPLDKPWGAYQETDSGT